MNIFIATGYVGKDPETRYAKTGTAITTFPLPVDQGWGDNKKTTWVKCTLFGRKGTGDTHGLVPYIAKGKLVTVHGEIVLEEWMGKDGTQQKMLCCIVSDLSVPKDGSAPQKHDMPPHADGVYQPAKGSEDFEEDIPF